MTDVASVLTKNMARGSGITHITIECVDNADVFPGVIVDDDTTFPIPSQQIDSVNVVVNNTLPQQISIECVDNCDGFPGEVVYDDISYPIPSQHDTIERTASGDGQSPYSSVRPFQLARYENEDSVTLDIDPPENASSVRPSRFPPFRLDEELDGCDPPDLK